MEEIARNKPRDNLTDDNVSIQTVNSCNSSFGKRNRSSMRIDDFAKQKVVNNIGIDSSRDIQIGNNTNYQGPVTVQVESLNLGGNLSFGKFAVKFKGLKTYEKYLISIFGLLLVGSLCVLGYFGYEALMKRPSLSKPEIFEDGPFDLITRSEWNAQSFNDSLVHEFSSHDSKKRIVLAALSIQNKTRCEAQAIFNYQSNAIDTFGDVPYNFIIGADPDNLIYEGRGFLIEPAGDTNFYNTSIYIAFIQTVNESAPTKGQYETLYRFLNRNIKEGNIHYKYSLYSYDDLLELNTTDAFNSDLRSWPKFTPKLKIYSMTEWYNFPDMYDFSGSPVNNAANIFFDYVVTNSCYTLDDCAEVIQGSSTNMDKYPYLFNFFIGGNEIVLEGEPMRRFNDYNISNERMKEIITVGFLGRYNERFDEDEIIRSASKLMQFLQSIGRLNMTCAVYTRTDLDLKELVKICNP